MIQYKNEIRLSNGYVYSLDMVRLNLYFREDAQKFLDWLTKYEMCVDGLEIKHWLSLKEYTFRNLFQIKTEQYSFSLAVGFNGNSEDKKKGFIEFNPNKCKGEIFDTIYKNIKSAVISTEVARFDLAIDIPVPKYLVKLIKDQRNYSFISNRGSDTEYLGQRNKPGYTKLYDKTKESKLDYDVTRLEITADLEGINFPTVKIIPYQISMDWSKLSSTEKVLVELLRKEENPNYYMKMLKYDKRKKLEAFLYEETVTLDEEAYNQIYKQVVAYQF